MANDLLRELQQMDDFQFEHLVADLWAKNGYRTEVEQQSGDRGVDVRAVDPRDGTKHLIQAKRYGANTTVGGPDVQQYAALRMQEDGVDDVYIVTTGGFSSQAKELARDLDVSLVNGPSLISLIEDSNARDVVAKYIPSVPTPAHAVLVDEFGQQTLNRITREAERARERANDDVVISPAEATELGIAADFDDEAVDPGRADEMDLAKHLIRMVDETDDLHFHDEGDVFVADLTDYVPHSVVASDADPPIAGLVEEDAADGAWRDATLEQVILTTDFGRDRFEAVTQAGATARAAANAEVVIDPDEAREYGVAGAFVDRHGPRPPENTPRENARRAVQMVLESDDVHMDESGDIFVADLTDYVPTPDVGPEADPPILGILDRAVPEGAWRETRFQRAGRWHYGLIASLAAVPALFVLPPLLGLVSGAAASVVAVLLLLSAVVGTLVFQLFDIGRVRGLHIPWTPGYGWYALGWLAVIGPLVYLYRRHKHVGLTGSGEGSS